MQQPGFNEIDETDADKEFVGTQPVDFGNGITTKMIIGTPSGPILAGTMEDVLTVDPPHLIGVDINPFAWDWVDICADAPILAATATVVLQNKPKLTSSFMRIGLTTCVKPVVVQDEDPHGQFASQYISVKTDGTIQVQIPIGEIKQAYLDDPYPCKLLIKTNGGARVVTLPSIPSLTPAQKQEFEDAQRLAKMFICTTWIEPWFYYIPDWKIDPPLDDKIVEHIWQVVVTNLDNSMTADFQDPHGNIIATTTKTGVGIQKVSSGADITSKTTQFDILTSPAKNRGRDQELVISTKSSSKTPPMKEIRQEKGGHGEQQKLSQSRRGSGILIIKQIQLLYEGGIQLNDRCSYLATDRFKGIPIVLCITSSGLSVYDIRNNAVPRLIYQYTENGLTGVIPTTDGLLVWAEKDGGRGVGDALFLISLETGEIRRVYHSKVSQDLPSPLIYDLIKYRNYYYALTRNGIDIYNQKLEKLSEVSVKGFYQMVVCKCGSGKKFGNSLVLSNKHRSLAIFDLSNPMKPVHVKTHEVIGAMDRLVQPRQLNGTNYVYIHDPKELIWRIFDLDDKGELQEIGYTKHDPWFVDAARIGKTIIRINQNFTKLNIYNVMGKLRLTAKDISSKSHTG